MFEQDLLARSREAVELARAAGASDVFASASRSRQVSASHRDGELESLQEATSRSLDLEIWVDGRYGSASTTDLRPDRLETFAGDLVALTRALEPDPDRRITDPTLYAGRSAVDLQLADPAVPTLRPEDRTALLETMAAAFAGQADVVSATCSASDTDGESASVSSNGFEGTSRGTSLWLSADVTLREGDKRPEGGSYGGARFRGDAPDPAWIGKDALEQARARIGSTKGPTTKTTMIVDPRAAGRLVGSLLTGVDGESVHQGRSHWVGKLGTKVVSPKLKITDDPHVVRGLASRYWDGEGIASQPRVVVADGALQTWFLDTTYARKLGLPPTTGGLSNRILGLGTRGRDALIGAAGDGVLVTSWLGGNMNPATGDFSYGIRGHVITGGKVGAPIGESNVTGNILALWAGLAELGDDPWPYGATRCPTLVFEGVQFS